MGFTAAAEREFYGRLHSSWPDLCTVLEIDEQDRDRFPTGEEGRQIWRWLKARKRLDELPDALLAIKREDLAETLEAGRLPDRAATEAGPRTPPGGPRLTGRALTEGYDAAAELERQGSYPEALRRLEAVTASVLGDRILLLLHLGREEEAARLLDQVDELHRRVGLFEDDPERLTAHYYRAALLWERRMLEQAETAYRTTLKARTEALGARDPETLRTRYSLAGVLTDRGRWQEAEAEYRAVLADRTAVLGESHPDTALARYGLADLLARRGRRREAEAEYRQALQVCRQCCGADHPSTLAIRYRLALLQRVERGVAATVTDLSAIRVALARVLGEDHPATRAVAGDLDRL
ncbi:tetratricopeptide repeat protein [Plantactinospora sp. B6F1]|uniref:tetratricopeptide repeat protein n=1 Tax=Plantactinospora sp. B6F1 TaxID=3158971 RepID=UPI00102B1B0F